MTKKTFKNFKAACQHYQFKGSHQVGSYGPKDGKGIVRSYSNGTPGKDFITVKKGEKTVVLYRLKDENYRRKFTENIDQKTPVRFFHKSDEGCEDLGLMEVQGFTDSGHVRMVSKEEA